MFFIRLFFCIILFSSSLFAKSSLKVGVGVSDLTPPIGTPSAGYLARKGQGMVGSHDPLLASAIVIHNGSELFAFCSVDHLGFLYEMTQEVKTQLQHDANLSRCSLFIGSSHTHSGGGAFCNIPVIGEMIAGPFNPEIRKFYIDAVVSAIKAAYASLEEAKIGIGYGLGPNITYYTGKWPPQCQTPSGISLIKITKLNGEPLALLYHYAVNPVVLRASNRVFSADLIGSTRNYLQSILGNVPVLYFNGAIGDLETTLEQSDDPFLICDKLGKLLGDSVIEIWNKIEAAPAVAISTYKDCYTFEVHPTPTALQLPIQSYNTEINLLVFNGKDAFLTIPAELSCAYLPILKTRAEELRYRALSVLGLVNDAHGYIFPPDAWNLKPKDAIFSFGGEFYGKRVEEKAFHLLELGAPITILPHPH